MSAPVKAITVPTPFAELYLACSEAEAEVWRPRRAELEPLLVAVLEQAEQAWPSFRLPRPAFIEHLAARVPLADLGAIRHPELYLALGCLRRHPQAVEAFDALLLRESASALRKFELPLDEMQQQLRERLLVGPKGSAPKLTEYSGRGPLGTWLRAVAVRVALNEWEKGAREKPVEPEVWEKLPASSHGGAELQVLRQHFKTHFKTAFAEAFGTLSAEERNLLRLHLLDGVSIDKLAVLVGAHRATAARRVVRAKEQLVTETRRVLSQQLRAPGAEVDELISLVRSQLDVSIRRHLLETSR